jgi:hypothetical protein
MACGAITGVAGAFCTISSGVVKVSGTSFQTSITVDLNGLVNPSASTSSFFSVRTYDASNNDIDSASTNYKYSVPCTLPCRSCTTTLTSCLSCYTSDNPANSCVKPKISNPINLCYCMQYFLIFRLQFNLFCLFFKL